MDFTQFDSRAAASQARELHLRHPATGALMYNDDEQKAPCIVLVKGVESPEVQKALGALQRGRLTGDGLSSQTVEDMHDSAVESAKLLVVGFKNMQRAENGVLRDMNLSDVEWFLRLQMANGAKGEKSFVEQVMQFASKRSNFLGKS